jgi:hypothetical protein
MTDQLAQNPHRLRPELHRPAGLAQHAGLQLKLELAETHPPGNPGHPTRIIDPQLRNLNPSAHFDAKEKASPFPAAVYGRKARLSLLLARKRR